MRVRHILALKKKQVRRSSGGSPGQVERQRDLQRGPLDAALGAETETGGLLVGRHRRDGQVSGVQSLQREKERRFTAAELAL